MEMIYGWVRTLIFCLCLLELFCHLVRGEEYRRYIRFFGSLAVLLLVFTPAAEFLSAGSSFEEALRQAFAKEDAYEFQVSQEALYGLQNSKIRQAYKEELERQMEAIVKAHGQQSADVAVTLDDDGEQYAISQITVVLRAQNRNLNVFEEDPENRRQQKEAAETIRAEIVSVYGVEKDSVYVSVKE